MEVIPVRPLFALPDRPSIKFFAVAAFIAATAKKMRRPDPN